jgi:hypothetical protein
MKSTPIIIGGVVVLGGLAFYLYNKNKSQTAMLPTAASSSDGGSVEPSSSSTPSPSYAAPVPTVKQTMWKDKDGNVFQLTSDKGQWGYIIKVNGSVQKKWNMMETMFLGPDGYVRGVDNNGSAYIWKGGQWNYVIKDNKTQAGQFLVEFGQPNVYLGLKGLGSLSQTAFALN